MDFVYLNDLYRNALSAWINEVFAGQESFLFDTRLAADEDFMGDQISDFWAYLTEAEGCRLVQIYHHPDGPYMLDVRRPTDNYCHRFGSMQQIELSMLYGHLQTIRYFEDGGRYTFSFTRKAINPLNQVIWSCRAEPDWPTLEACRSTIDRILRLNPAHAVEVADVTLGPSYKEQLDAELMAPKAATQELSVGDHRGLAPVINIDKNLRHLGRSDSDPTDPQS